MEDKKSRYINLLSMLLIISIFLNVYQFTAVQSAKKVERDATLKNFELITNNYLAMSNNLDNFIKATTDLGAKEDQDTSEIFSIWNGIYSTSKEIECKLSTVDRRYYNSVSNEILNLQHIMSITNKSLYTLNTEFLKNNSQPFKISEQERETLEAVAAIYRLIGDGIKIQEGIVFMPGLFEKLLAPLKIIDTTGWWKVMQQGT